MIRQFTINIAPFYKLLPLFQALEHTEQENIKILHDEITPDDLQPFA